MESVSMSINAAKSSQAISLKAKRKKTSKLMPKDDSRHVQLVGYPYSTY